MTLQQEIIKRKQHLDLNNLDHYEARIEELEWVESKIKEEKHL